MATLTLPKWADNSSNIYTDITDYEDDEERNLGFQPNTVVNSKIMNTVLHAHDNMLAGLCDTFNEYYDGDSLTLMSSEEEWKNFFKAYMTNVDKKFTNIDDEFLEVDDKLTSVNDKFAKETLTITENKTTGDVLTFTNGNDVEYTATITNSKHSSDADTISGGRSDQFYKSNGTNGAWSTVSSTKVLKSTSTSTFTYIGTWNGFANMYVLEGATFLSSLLLCQIGLCYGTYGYGLLLFLEDNGSFGTYLLIGRCTASAGASISLTLTTLSSDIAGISFLNN